VVRALVAGVVSLVAAGAAAAPASALDRWWLGKEFERLPLTHEERGLFVYGDCDPEPDGGCPPPLQVQNDTTCGRNPVALDVAAQRLHRLRGGGIVADYGDGIDLLTGGSTVTVFSTPARERRAVRAVRPRRAGEPPPQLRRPRLPWPVLAEVKRVAVAARRHDSRRAISRATGVSPGRVRVRLRLAELLGRDALAGVPAPRISWRTVRRYRQVAFWAQEFGPRAARERFDLTRAELRRIVRRVRGLTGDC
jgi:hypothetical protein